MIWIVINCAQFVSNLKFCFSMAGISNHILLSVPNTEEHFTHSQKAYEAFSELRDFSDF